MPFMTLRNGALATWWNGSIISSMAAKGCVCVCDGGFLNAVHHSIVASPEIARVSNQVALKQQCLSSLGCKF